MICNKCLKITQFNLKLTIYKSVHHVDKYTQKTPTTFRLYFIVDFCWCVFCNMGEMGGAVFALTLSLWIVVNRYFGK